MPGSPAAAGAPEEAAGPHGASLAGRSVLVTGGHGLIGGHLTEALLARGARVTLIVRGRSPRSRAGVLGLERRCTVVDGDLTTPGLAERAIAEQECEAVFHLAGQSILRTARSSPLGTFESNVRGTWLLMEACRLHDVGRVLVASSYKAYGRRREEPYVEDVHALLPEQPYDVSKACLEHVALSYAHTYGLGVTALRLVNVYGSGDEALSRLVPEAVAAVLGGRRPVVRSDGSPEREYLHAADAATAYLAVADLLDRGAGSGEAYNAGTGELRSVLEVVQTVCRIAGLDVGADVRGTPVAGAAVDRQSVSTAKLAEATGWAPSMGLEDGLRETLDWSRRQLGQGG